MNTTQQNQKYWEDRKINWKEAYSSTWNHPHRDMLVGLLSKLSWRGLYEVGCGSGPNLIKILKHFPGVSLGGSDVNADAIKEAKETFNNGHFDVSPAWDTMMSDDSVDVVLSDMTLIYIGRDKIHKTIKEMRRISRKYVVLCELHSTNIFKRWYERLTGRYNIYDYAKLLKKYDFTDITLIKIPKEVWDGKPQKPFGYFILAKTPKIKL